VADVAYMMQVVPGTVRKLHLRNTPGMPQPLKFGPKSWRFWLGEVKAWLTRP
jgi:hypothetical protein